MKPLFVVLAAVLGESFSPRLLLASLLILGGIGLAVLGHRDRSEGRR